MKEFSIIMNRAIIRIITTFLCLTLLPVPVRGLSFDPHSIISDEEFFKADDMSRDEIQTFLQKKGSALAIYTTKDSEGKNISAADIISQAAHDYQINPKTLLVLLQKEQSLVENPTPTQYAIDWATGYGRCDSCSAQDPQLRAYKGFSNQVERAAWQTQLYVQSASSLHFKPYVTRLVDGVPITPKNVATAILYTYTPHLHGNYSFWKIWNRYFSKIFPDGIVVQEKGKNELWLIAQGKKRQFSSLSVFRSRNSGSIITVEPHSLDQYETGTPLKFPQYSLLQGPDKKISLLVGEKRFIIASQAVFRKIGFNPDEIIKASKQDLASIDIEGTISNPTLNPLGELMQDKKTGSVYYVHEKIRQPLLEEAVLRANFNHWKIKKVTQKTLEKYEQSDPVLFKDGVLVKQDGDDRVFIISNGQKRPIISQDDFAALGFDFSQVIMSNGSTLDLLSTGDTIDLGIDNQEESQDQLMISSENQLKVIK